LFWTGVHAAEATAVEAPHGPADARQSPLVLTAQSLDHTYLFQAYKADMLDVLLIFVLITMVIPQSRGRAENASDTLCEAHYL